MHSDNMHFKSLCLSLHGEFKRPKLLGDNRVLRVVDQFRSFDIDTGAVWFTAASSKFFR